MQSNAKAQGWLDTNLYPFQSRFIALEAGNMHYIDEGEGDVILFVHGTPTWSFLYRNQIKALANNFRCIAIDHIGFGLSDKPEDFSYHPSKLSKHLKEFIDSLELKEITLVVHDFGGPIGMPYALDNPNNVKRLVLFNTWLWATDANKDVKTINKIVNSFVGRWLYLHLNFSAGYLLQNAVENKGDLSKKAKHHYKNVFSSRSKRYGPYKIAQQLKGASDFYATQWEKIHKLKDKPTLILWGMKDDFIKPSFLAKWKSEFSHAQVRKLDCGHFPQEEETTLVNEALLQFIGQNIKKQERFSNE